MATFAYAELEAPVFPRYMEDYLKREELMEDRFEGHSDELGSNN